MCGGCLKVINWGWRCKSQKRSSFHREGRFSLCNTAILWNFIGSYWVYTVKNFTSFHYTTVVLRVWGCQSQKCNGKCPNDINTELDIPEIFLSFLLYPDNSISLTCPPPPPYSACSVISDCNHSFDTSTFTHKFHKNTFIVIENAYLNGVFLKSKISIFP